MAAAALEYANRTGRRPGRVVTALGWVLPGVAEVQRQAAPFAQAWHESNRRVLGATQPADRRWIVLGDSMSQGLGARTVDGGWVSQAQASAAARDVRLDVVNLSASGALVPDLLEQQLPAWRSLPTPAGGDPDVVTVLIGSNDLLRRRHRDALPGAFAQLLAELPAGAIVATLPQPRRAAREANTVMEQAAAEQGIVLLDMRRSGPSSWRGKLAADHFHPNEAGYRAIAQAFEPLVLAAATGG